MIIIYCRYRHLSHSKYRKELDIIFGVELQSNENSQDASNCEYSTESKRMKTSLGSCIPCSGDVPFLPMQVSYISEFEFLNILVILQTIAALHLFVNAEDVNYFCSTLLVVFVFFIIILSILIKMSEC